LLDGAPKFRTDKHKKIIRVEPFFTLMIANVASMQMFEITLGKFSVGGICARRTYV